MYKNAHSRPVLLSSFAVSFIPKIQATKGMMLPGLEVGRYSSTLFEYPFIMTSINILLKQK